MPVFTQELDLKNKIGKKLIILNESNSFTIYWEDVQYNSGYFLHKISTSSVSVCVREMRFKCATDDTEYILIPGKELVCKTLYNVAILIIEYDDTNEQPFTSPLSQYRPLKTISSVLAQALATTQLADAIFHTNDGEKVYANRCILHCQSDIFKALFDEKPDIPTEIEVNFSKNIVTRAMEFCYGKIDIIEGFEGELINFADKYGIKELKEVCQKSLEATILTCENVCAIVILAFQHGYDMLKEKCVAFLRQNKSQIGAEQISYLPNEILVSTIMSF